MKANILATIATMATIMVSCSTEDPQLKTSHLDLPAIADQYGLGINDQIPTLGRVLFYDKQLSVNNSVSCASCHKQSLAFTDNARFSKGFENILTSRNSMPIQNLNPINSGIVLFNGNGAMIENNDLRISGEVNFIGNGDTFIPFSGTSLFWDGREKDIRTMVLRPIANHVEMGIRDFDKLAVKLASIPYYKDLFFKAYGSEEVTVEKISEGLTSFLQSITSNQTKLDKVNAGTEQLTALEQQGQFLFTDSYDCNACHQVQNPIGYLFAQGGIFANIGLDPTNPDIGLASVTQMPTDGGKFKIPSLRNVALTAPYMHDGRFADLESVMEHYSTGLQDNPNLDTRLRDGNGSALRLNIPPNEKKAIIAFLNTLTDHTMITDPKFSNPFKAK
jgi:cytochrome c peroxidase